MKFLIVGLGNIGKEYEHTRHNIGFDVVAAFVNKHGGTFNVDRLAYVAEVKWKGTSFVCICPTTYMNLSGRAVKYWLDKEKIPLERSLTILDDLALPLEKIRIKPTGSDGGHNGLKSIQESVNSLDYPKLRFGIGSNYPKGMQADFVLSKWKPQEEPIVKNKIELCIDVIEVFAKQGIQEAMNNFNKVNIKL